MIGFMGVLGFIKYMFCFPSCALNMGTLLFCTILFLIFTNDLLKRKTRQLLGDRRIMYAEIIDVSWVAI